jgi:type I restriction enzyme S subunit
MSKWSFVALGEICEITGGNSAPQGTEPFNGGVVPFVRMRDLGRYHFTSNLDATDDKLTESAIQKYRMKVFEPGCILFPRSGSVFLNHRAILGTRAAIVSHIGILHKFSNLINVRFLYYYLQTYDMTRLSKKTTGVDSIAFSDVAKIKVPLPPLPEQERIVRLLDEAESLRAARLRANERMSQFVPALFHEMFGDPVKTEFPIKTLNEVADVVSGIAKGRKFNGQRPVTINYLRVANVQAGYLDLSEIKTIEALPSEVEELQVKIGDVLLTEGGDFDKLGRGAMLEVDLPNCIHQNHVFRARVNRDYLLPVFFHDFLQTQQAKKYFLSCAKKTTNLASINLTQLRALPVPLPPIALQREFAARVEEARGVQSAQRKSAERVEALVQSMLARAFTGEL